ncbi:MAG: nucleoside phosphorylase [Actinomycetes bacterium]
MIGGSDNGDAYPLLVGKAYLEPSVFRPQNLLREARRQRRLPDEPVPAVCLLDPDGDIVRYLAATGAGDRHRGWACYHTDMWVTDLDGIEVGVIGTAVGAPFAVLVAEQLAVSGAELVISITSAGQLRALADPPYFVLIEKAWRDEGTSAHYQPPAPWAHLPPQLQGPLTVALAQGGLPDLVFVGASWTTDAPYRETQTAIRAAVAASAVCVEMEAAALYAYAAARGRDVVCLAHITNTMAVTGEDFEKGAANGAPAALDLAAAISRTLRAG